MFVGGGSIGFGTKLIGKGFASSVAGGGFRSAIGSGATIYAGSAFVGTGYNVFTNSFDSAVNQRNSTVNYVKNSVNGVTNLGGMINSAVDLVQADGVARLSFALTTPDKNFEIKALSGLGFVGVSDDKLVALQGKLPQLGNEFTGQLADATSLNSLPGFQKDNVNASVRAGYDFSTNSGSIDGILETDFSKGDIPRLNLGRFGKFKGSIGARTINGVSVPAINVGYEVPFLFGTSFTVSGEFRGR